MDKQDEIFHLLCSGYTQPEIAKKIGCSLSTVEKVLKALRKEYGAKTMFHLGYLLGVRG